MPDDVSVEVVVADGGTGRGRVIMLTLGWRAADPLAVVLVLSAQPDHPALPRGRWVVLRDFLQYGLEEPTGDGNVRIRPEPNRIRLDLYAGDRPSGRPVTVGVPAGVVRHFLAETERVVPVGAERSEAALDALIERLLRA
jgi:hypothetical protein